MEVRRKFKGLGQGYWGSGIRFCLDNSLLAAMASLGPYDLIIHVGAHTAHEPPTYEALGARRVVWVEADPETARRTGEALARRKGAIHVLVNVAASDCTGESRRLHRFSNDGASSSLHAPGDAFSRTAPNVWWTGESVEVKTATLSDILGYAMTTISDFANVLLVVDVQGHEYEVLSGADVADLRQLTAILCEVSSAPVYRGARGSDEVTQLLRGRGFVGITREPEIHGDVLFLNTERRHLSRTTRL